MKPTIFSAAGGGIALLLGVTAWLAPAAQASQRPAHPGPAASTARPVNVHRLTTTYPYNWSRIAWTGVNEVIAGTDSHGDLYYFSQASGGTTWHKQLVAKGGGGFAYKHPSIAWEGSAVVITALDASGDLVYFAKPSSSSTWNYELVSTAASFGGQFESPAITAGDGEVLISTANKSGELVTFEQAYNGPSWNEQTVAFGTFGASSITTVFDSLDQAYLGLLTASTGGTLYFWYEYLATPGWNQQTVAASGSQGSYTGGSIMASANNLVITAASTTGSVYAWTQAIGATGWTQSTVASASGSTTYANPQTAWTGFVSGTSVSYDIITATTKAGALDYWWVSDGDAGPWNPETIAKKGTTAVYANPGIAVSSTSVLVTAINTKPGDVMFWHQGLGTNPWYKQVVAKG